MTKKSSCRLLAFGLVMIFAPIGYLSVYLYNYQLFWVNAQAKIEPNNFVINNHLNDGLNRSVVQVRQALDQSANILTEKENSQESSPRLLPPKDSTLSTENRIRIDKLGVDAEIIQGDDSEAALDKGPWIVPGFKTPSGNALLERPEPVIIASHLYGSTDWSEEFRDRVSFNGLGNLEAGDLIEIVWQQRLYVYEIKDGEVNDEISRYDVDLILYTCVDLNGSAERIIRYANWREDLI